jgi:hypothetical protein
MRQAAEEDPLNRVAWMARDWRAYLGASLPTITATPYWQELEKCRMAPKDSMSYLRKKAAEL